MGGQSDHFGSGELSGGQRILLGDQKDDLNALTRSVDQRNYSNAVDQTSWTL